MPRLTSEVHGNEVDDELRDLHGSEVLLPLNSEQTPLVRMTSYAAFHSHIPRSYVRRQ